MSENVTKRFNVNRVRQARGLVGAAKKLRRASGIRMRQALKIDKYGDMFQKKVEEYQRLVNRFIEVAQGLAGEIRALQLQIQTEQRIIQVKTRERLRALQAVKKFQGVVQMGMRQKVQIEKAEQKARAQAAAYANMSINAESNAVQRAGQVSMNAQRAIARQGV